MTRPRHALDDWARLRRRLQDAKPLLLLADYDGTLAPIAPTPSQARLPRRVKLLLHRLSRVEGVQVGIVSGRAARTVRRLVGLPGVIYVGNHGGEVLGPGLRFVHREVRRHRPTIRRLEAALRRALRGVSGCLVEAKGWSVSVHWRLVKPRELSRFSGILRSSLQPWLAQRSIRVTHGKRVIEIRAPVDWDKGRSVEWLVRQTARSRRPAVWYLGDDRTDEDAFRAVNRLRGVSIFVGQRATPTAAKWRLRSPHEVVRLLNRLLRERWSLNRLAG
ncbi:MAG: trehalose-phosphatase [Candidatus Omnitrophica bacterium]|nr:trehalose-phosphatase [Candidatus Omnitrophota bacterium]